MAAAVKNIENVPFRARDVPPPVDVETPAACCQQVTRPIASGVGLYIPRRLGPLFNGVLMLATPARIAGCQNVVLALAAAHR